MQLLAMIIDSFFSGHPLYEEAKAKLAEERKENCPEFIYPIFKDGKRQDIKVCCSRKVHDDEYCTDGQIAWKKGYQPPEEMPDEEEESTVHNERSQVNLNAYYGKRLRLVDFRSAYPAELIEPTFTIRARDSLGPEIVREWIFRAKVAGVNQEKIDDARRIANEMEDWQLTNGRKIAD